MSKSFDWKISIDGLVYKRAMSELGINLMDAGVDLQAFLGNLANKPDVYLDLLWICCEEQAISKGVDEVAFVKGILGKGLIESQDAFVLALADFFQNDQLSQAVRLVVDEMKVARKAAQEKAKEAMESMQSNSTRTSSSSQESSESTRTEDLYVS